MTCKEAMTLALNKAFQLGQRYWSWADSEYSSHWKKADAAKSEFDQLVQDTINAALAEQPSQQGCMRCNTPKKCALYGCSPLTWPSEQPAQQEPFAWADLNALTAQFNSVNCGTAYRLPGEDRQPLYTSPQAQRKPLTSQERDAQRWRFLMENSYDSQSVTQFHVWEHSWEPHSKTGEPTEWKQRVRGIALIDFIDRAIEAAHEIKGDA